MQKLFRTIAITMLAPFSLIGTAHAGDVSIERSTKSETGGLSSRRRLSGSNRAIL